MGQKVERLHNSIVLGGFIYNRTETSMLALLSQSPLKYTVYLYKKDQLILEELARVGKRFLDTSEEVHVSVMT